MIFAILHSLKKVMIIVLILKDLAHIVLTSTFPLSNVFWSFSQCSVRKTHLF